MFRSLIMTAISTLMLSFSSPSQAESQRFKTDGVTLRAEYLYKACSSSQQQMQLFCIFYIDAFIYGAKMQIAFLTEGSYNPELAFKKLFCAPETYDLDDVRQLFIKFWLARPESRNEDAGMMLASMFYVEWPSENCMGDD